MKRKIYHIVFALLLLLSKSSWSQKSSNQPPWFFYPKSFNTLNFATSLGLSITKFPVNLVDDEINTAPLLKFDFRMGVSKTADLTFQFYTNYIVNNGSLGMQWQLFDGDLCAAIGAKTSVWFGQLELEAFRLKSMGVVISPLFNIGYRTDDFTISSIIEIQSSYMKTLSHDILLGEFTRPLSAYSIRFIIEQPLWNDQWVALEIKLNYAKFYYQSWLTYSTIDEFFFYPEFSFGFIL